MNLNNKKYFFLLFPSLDWTFNEFFVFFWMYSKLVLSFKVAVSRLSSIKDLNFVLKFLGWGNQKEKAAKLWNSKLFENSKTIDFSLSKYFFSICFKKFSKFIFVKMGKPKNPPPQKKKVPIFDRTYRMSHNTETPWMFRNKLDLHIWV